jgi:hypothetical protein
LAALIAITLPGCVSLAGSQNRIIDPRQPDGGLPGMSIRDVLREYDEPTTNNNNNNNNNNRGGDRRTPTAGNPRPELRGSRSQRAWRNYVVSIYQAAIEANFAQFSGRMSSERRELGLGADIVTNAFTTYATVARQSIVNDLSAAAAGFAGLRGATERNVYGDRTMTALVSSMEAERARIKARIADGLTRSAEAYSLYDALRDLSQLEAAGSMDRAVADLTAHATEQRQQADRLLASTVRTCNADADATPVVDRLSDHLHRLSDPVPGNVAREQANMDKLRRIAVAMDLPVDLLPQNAESFRHAIFVRIGQGRNGRCAKDDLEELIAMILRETGDRVP